MEEGGRRGVVSGCPPPQLKTCSVGKNLSAQNKNITENELLPKIRMTIEIYQITENIYSTLFSEVSQYTQLFKETLTVICPPLKIIAIG